MELYVGVDGCPRGWFFVAINKVSEWQVGIALSITELWGLFAHSELILIDIPIGLPWEGPRQCDIEARKLLGSAKASSVFPTPARESILAKNYSAACRINERILGKRLSMQSWGITRKIGEIDAFLHHFREARKKIRETHPELCYFGLSGRTLKSKKSPDGITERLAVLDKHLPGARELFKFSVNTFPRNAVNQDDVLDACVASVTARYSEHGLSTVPDDPGLDQQGLPMEMAYYSAS
jgi:predicted RNase H-like nuclease